MEKIDPKQSGTFDAANSIDRACAHINTSPRNRWVELWHRRHVIKPELPSYYNESEKVHMVYIFRPSDYDLFLRHYRLNAFENIDRISASMHKLFGSNVKLKALTENLRSGPLRSHIVRRDSEMTTSREPQFNRMLEYVQKFSPTKSFRAKKELCLLQRTSDMESDDKNSKKVWELSDGYIGRENGENVVIPTNEASMDLLHARIIVSGDDYLIQDNDSSTGTYLCLSTHRRQYSQRYGYHLSNKDVVYMGCNSIITIRTSDSNDITPQNSHNADTKQQNDHDPKPRKAGKRVHFADFPSVLSNPEGDHHQRWSIVSKAFKNKTGGSQKQILEDACGSVLGSIYRRNVQSAAYRQERISTKLFVSTSLPGEKETWLPLKGKNSYTIGSDRACDIQVFGSGVRAVHARIINDGYHFILQDLSLEERNPALRTRVRLIQPTKLACGDLILFGDCVMAVALASSVLDPTYSDFQEVGLRCHVLRHSKRKARQKQKYLPIVYRHSQATPLIVGRGSTCSGKLQTTSINLRQFNLYLDNGICYLIPHGAGLNQGLYYLIGRGIYLHGQDECVQYTSKPLKLEAQVVIRCGSSELEVSHIKCQSSKQAKQASQEICDNAKALQKLFWLQQFDQEQELLINIATKSQRIELEPGDCVYDAGDIATFFFVVLDGDINLTFPSLDPASSGSNLLKNSDQCKFQEPHVERLGSGSYFGEVCLIQKDLAYVESAHALTKSLVLVVDAGDFCGFFSPYMDIIHAQLAYESYRDLLMVWRLSVPYFANLEYDELRMLANKVDHYTYTKNQPIVLGGEFQTSKNAHGILLLYRGKADVKDENSLRSFDGEILQSAKEWTRYECLTSLPHEAIEAQYNNVIARSDQVECFFLHANELLRPTSSFDTPRKKTYSRLHTASSRKESLEPAVDAHKFPERRRKSSVVQLHHSRAHWTSQAMGTVPSNRSFTRLEQANMEDDESFNQKWRRKKRNRALLEQTITDVEQNPDLSNALVLYVLSGANRGDIHVIRNVGSIGRTHSRCDIELNDCHVSQSQALIEHRDGCYWLYDTQSEWGTFVRLEEAQQFQVDIGDVLMAGEVEFTCLGSVQSRDKPSSCCLQ
ncbi:unnamed protein product [Albugo candida]|uniref:FHA domain-containing protein n=1 Tax=Albugo candida TaxID=65357 RepID=A0A024G134_9STRA|nr:unnamed protein product [Albugo candida]|eukprot:CCI40459.1 unnamed protein product [Albugo candida]